jgi:hypothetical protein
MEQANRHGSLYHITIKGTKEPSHPDWFDEVTVVRQKDGNTVLAGTFIDQPALRGFLDHLWNMNFSILSLERIEQNQTPKTHHKMDGKD